MLKKNQILNLVSEKICFGTSKPNKLHICSRSPQLIAVVGTTCVFTSELPEVRMKFAV